MITRRTFVKAGGCALVAYAGAPRFLVRAAHAAPPSGKVLVAIFQRGAVDGLSMVMPFGDPGYAGVRLVQSGTSGDSAGCSAKKPSRSAARSRSPGLGACRPIDGRTPA